MSDANPAEGVAAAEGPKQVTEASKEELEKAAKEKAFASKPLEYVTQKWQQQVRQNEKQFTDAAS